MREAVVDSVYNLYLRDGPATGVGANANAAAAAAAGGPRAHAKALIGLVAGASLGELSALDEILARLLAPAGAAAAAAASLRPTYELSSAVIGYVLRYLLDSVRAACAAKAQLRGGAARAAQNNSSPAAAAAAAPTTAEEAFARALQMARCSSTLVSMIAAHQPSSVAPHLDRLLDALAAAHGDLGDAWVTRYGCATLQALGPHLKAAPPLPVAAAVPGKKMFALLARVLLAGAALPEENWCSAAEAAVAALYALHPSPQQLVAPVLANMASAAFPGAAISSGGGSANGDVVAVAEDLSSVGVQPLSHFLFALGHAAIHHLVLVDRLAKAVRQARAAKERAALITAASAPAAPAAASGSGRGKRGSDSGAAAAPPAPPGANDDIASQVGFGSVAADAALDLLKEGVESELMAGGNLVGAWGGVVAALAGKPALLAAAPALRASALLALTKLMALDAAYCERHMPLLFTLLGNAGLEAGVRNNLIVALGDLAFRYARAWVAGRQDFFVSIAV